MFQSPLNKPRCNLRMPLIHLIESGVMKLMATNKISSILVGFLGFGNGRELGRGDRHLPDAIELDDLY